MGKSELLMTIGAVTAFGTVTLSVNSSVIRNNEAVYEQQAEFYALSIAQQFIEEAKLKAFDTNTVAATVADESAFTSPGALGPGGPDDLDDVDDYNGLSRTVNTEIGKMHIGITVGYISETNWETVVSAKTYYKKMAVTIQSPYLNRPVSVDYVFSFYKTLL